MYVIIAILLVTTLRKVTLETTCYSSTDPSKDKVYGDLDLEFLEIFYISSDADNVEIICFSSNNFADFKEHSIDIYNETMKSSLYSNYSETGQFKFTIPSKIFSYDPRDGVFYFPKWDFRIKFRARIELTGTIHLISKKASSIFKSTITIVQKPESKNLTKSLSNGNIYFDLTINKSKPGMQLKLYFLEMHYGTSTIITNHIKSYIKFAVTAKSLIVLSDDKIYNVEYNTYTEDYVINEIRVTANNSFYDMSYQSDCSWFGLHEPSKSDFIILYPSNNNDTFFYLFYPFTQVKMFDIVQAVILGWKTIYAVYDFERMNFLLLMKNRSEDLYSINVLNKTGFMKCQPFYIRSNHSIYEITYDKANGRYTVTSEEKMWFSTDGGCIFQKEHLKVKYLSLSFVKKDLLKLHISNTSKDISEESRSEVVLFKYGFLDLSVNFDSRNMLYHSKFYLNRNLPLSNALITHSVVKISKVTENNYFLQMLNGVWPFYSLNDKFHCFLFSMTCCITNYVNETTLLGECYFDFASKVEDQIICPKHLWYLADRYYVTHKNTSIDIKNATHMNATSFNGSIDFKNQSHVYFTADALGGYVLRNNAMSELYTYKPMTENVKSGRQNIKVEDKYLSIIELLFDVGGDCPFDMVVTGTSDNLIYLDLHEYIELTVTLKIDPTAFIPKELLRKKLISIHMTNSKSTDIRLKYFSYKNEQSIKMAIKQKQVGILSAVTSLRISSLIKQKNCGNLSHTVKIAGACSTEKYLMFRYPLEFTIEDFFDDNVYDPGDDKRLYDLPVNYQPPSSKGVAIPMTSHVYNADPSMPLYFERYLDSQPLHNFKQCNGKKNRLDCNCTRLMQTSFRLSDSDCIYRVYRLFYSEKLNPKVYLKHDDIISQLEKAYYIKELNNREDYFLIDTKDNDEKIMSQQSSISFKGSGLYHFKVELVDKTISFCLLETEFIVYIDGAPLPHPAEDLVRAGTSMIFGTAILGVFLFQYYRNAV